MTEDRKQAANHTMETSRQAVLEQLDALDAELADAAPDDRAGIYQQLMQWFDAHTLSEDDAAWVAERAQEMALQYGILDVTHPDARM